MNWKKEAVDKLSRYSAMRIALKSIPEELARLEAEACALRGATADKTPVKGGGNGREGAMINNLVHRQELSWALEQAKHWVHATDLALSVLDPEERLVLHKMYVEPEMRAMDGLIMALQTEQSSVYRKRDAALRKFTLALYGKLES